jgi:hypothetical protein
VAFLLRLPTLAFAVGVYLPLSTMAPVFLGGLLRFLLTRRQVEPVAAARREQGVLFGSGLVGGEGLMGVGLALVVLVSGQRSLPALFPMPASMLNILAVPALAALLALIAWSACRKPAVRA